MRRFICLIAGHDWAGPRNRWTFCMRCKRNVYTANWRGR